MTATNAPWQHCFVETNDIRLHCVTQGEGELVLLLHGFPEFWYSWRFQIPALARHFKVVVPDLRGYNDSDKPAGGYDLDTLSADVRGLVEALGYAKAHVVGHDIGGSIAWNLAQQFPQYIDRLAVLNSPHPQHLARELIGNLDRLRRNWHVLALQVPGIPELLRHNLGDFVKTVFQGEAIRKGAFDREHAQIYRAALEKPGVLAAIANYYRQLFNPQDWQKSPDPVTAPTLVLWGEEDSILNRQLAEGLDRLISAPFQVRFVSRCGHWIQQEVPQTVNRELRTFLRGKS